MSEASSIAVETVSQSALAAARPLRPIGKLRWLWIGIGTSIVSFAAFITLTGPVIALFIGPVDRVLVDKSARKLWLMRDGERLYEADISLGKNPVGQKQREGDQRTPEGRYRLDWRDGSTDYHRAILVSYPGKADR